MKLAISRQPPAVSRKLRTESRDLRPEKAATKRLVLRRFSGDSPAMEIVFTVTQEGDGGYVAECLSHDIFTQGNTWEELRANVREAVSAYFFDQPKPAAVRLHLVRDELLAGA
jgi:predicted RNase H-like HicB family nuclease